MEKVEEIIKKSFADKIKRHKKFMDVFAYIIQLWKKGITDFTTNRVIAALDVSHPETLEILKSFSEKGYLKIRRVGKAGTSYIWEIVLNDGSPKILEIYKQIFGEQ